MAGEIKLTEEEPSTPAQREYILQRAGDLGWKEDDLKAHLLKEYGTDSLEDLTGMQAAELLGYLRQEVVKLHARKAKEKEQRKEEARSESTPVLPMEIVTPAVRMDQALAAFKEFSRFKSSVLTDDDYLFIGIDGKPTSKEKAVGQHIKKSGWRKLALIFNLSIEILDAHRSVHRDEEGEYYVWTYRVRARAPNGRFQDAEGVATSRDPFFSKKAGERVTPNEANIKMKAETVAINRAISSLVGGGEISAEEIES